MFGDVISHALDALSAAAAFIVFAVLAIVYIIAGGHPARSFDGGGEPARLRVMGFNIEYGAEYYSVAAAADVIKKSGADVAILSEVVSFDKTDVSPQIASLLGYHVESFESNQTAIVSRFPMTRVDDAGIVKLVCGRTNHSIYIVSVHFSDFPYQPNQAASIPYCYDVCQKAYKSEASLVKQAKIARGAAVAAIIEKINAIKAGESPSTLPMIILAGDFNEPSHLDWTERAAAAKLHPFAVAYPTSKAFQDAGLIDVFRHIYPDEVKKPGYTWPTRDPGYPYRDDRIDFIFVDAEHAATLGKKPLCKVIKNPSDHYALLCEFDMN
jgi:endonuclease/exonuclease/phosphatase family metal-dependent hydrolase